MASMRLAKGLTKVSYLKPMAGIITYHFSVALTWFKEQFIKCHDRAALVKTWLPAQYSGPPTFLDQLVYDRALTLVGACSFVKVEDLLTIDLE